jgi:IS4 transposase
MTHESLINDDWKWTVERLGGEESLSASARETKAFLRARAVRSAVDLLRLTLAYCLGHVGLRATAGWAQAMGLAALSDVALLERLRNTGEWLSHLIAGLLAKERPEAAQGRLIRILDATSVAKAGAQAKRDNSLWRVHSAFELPSERFDFLELTDEHGGERIDRVPVVAGEIRIGDRGYLQADRIGAVMSQGADVLVRASWRQARWLDASGGPLDLLATLEKASPAGWADQPIWLGRKKALPLALRLVALRKPPAAAAEARRKARRYAQREGHQLSAGTLAAADWVILITSLPPETFATEDIFKLYRMRWRIELAFKRLKSLIGLRSPPAQDPRLAKPWLLSHLLMILLAEPLIDEFGVSPP